MSLSLRVRRGKNNAARTRRANSFHASSAPCGDLGFFQYTWAPTILFTTCDSAHMWRERDDFQKLTVEVFSPFSDCETAESVWCNPRRSSLQRVLSTTVWALDLYESKTEWASAGLDPWPLRRCLSLLRERRSQSVVSGMFVGGRHNFPLTDWWERVGVCILTARDTRASKTWGFKEITKVKLLFVGAFCHASFLIILQIEI